MTSAVSVPLWTQFFDPYDLRARVRPALLCLLPPLVVLVLVYPTSMTWQSTVLGLVLWCGGFFLLSRIARDAGKRIQDSLYEQWSGAPTTRLLRHRDRRLDVHSKRSLHAKLSALTGVPIPTPEQEDNNCDAADEAYRAAALWLIKHTRDSKRFALLFKENTNFGFQRNALGLRWVGVAIAVLTIAWLLVVSGLVSFSAPHFHVDRWQSLSLGIGASLVVSIVMLAVWVLAITPDSAQRTGFAYAERLMECADALSADATATKATAGGHA